ncbi:MAG: Phosphoribosyl-AMP cyclohydrolase, partial [uncultured Acidimicrobiales bacterium]
ASDHPHPGLRGRARPREVRRRRARARDRAGPRGRPGADDGVDERRHVGPDPGHRADGVLEPLAPGGVGQGGDERGPPVGPGGVLRLRRRHAAVPGRAGGPRRLPHRRAQLLLPCLRDCRRAV